MPAPLKSGRDAMPGPTRSAERDIACGGRDRTRDATTQRADRETGRIQCVHGLGCWRYVVSRHEESHPARRRPLARRIDRGAARHCKHGPQDHRHPLSRDPLRGDRPRCRERLLEDKSFARRAMSTSPRVSAGLAARIFERCRLRPDEFGICADEKSQLPALRRRQHGARRPGARRAGRRRVPPAAGRWPARAAISTGFHIS
jgi:hypothetical protein